MKPSIHNSRKTSGAFTLVEIMVSITVLGLIMVGIAQVMNTAISATVGGYKHMDADTQARLVLDRIAFDISKITKRTDIDYYFQKNNGNDQMAFFSESGGYYPNAVTSPTQEGNVSLVGYMINSSNQLVRLSKGLTWNGFSTTLPSMVFNAFPTSITSNTITTTWPQVPTGTDPDYQVLGDQIFRLEYTFLVQTAPTGSNGASVTNTYFYDYPSLKSTDQTASGLQNVTAIIVTIAVLDSKSRALVTNSTLQAAASNLPDATTFKAATPTTATTTTNLPLSLWKNKLATSTLGLPQAAASQVRFYQRFCYLNKLQ